MDRPMVLGIRPDAFSVEAPRRSGETGGGGQGKPARISVKISLVEPLGDRKDIYMATPGQKNLVGRVDARVPVFEGQEGADVLGNESGTPLRTR